MTLALTLPFFIQSLLHLFDEFYFHKKRSPLPKWELWGHPFDTFWVLAIYALSLYAPFHILSFWFFIFLFLASCLSITKDEWVHYKVSSPWENWIHALLFIVHPLVLISIGLIGVSRFHSLLGWPYLKDIHSLLLLLQFFALATSIVFIFQVVEGVRKWKK